MIGTWVNVGGIVLGALIGVLVNRGIPAHINAAILKIEGVAIAVIGLNGILAAMLRADPDTGRITDNGGLILLISLVLGCIAGEALRIDDRLNGLGLRLEKKFGAAGFAKGFVSASLVFSIGAMGIIGAINDGLEGDASVLYIKTMLDTTTAIVMASALGIGVAFSAIPVLLVQGTFSLLAVAISPFIVQDLLDLFCMVGYALVMCIGINFVVEAKIKVANLLPSLVVPVAYYFWIIPLLERVAA